MAVTLGTVAPVGFEDFANPEWISCMKRLGCQTLQVYRNREGNDSAHQGSVTTQQMKEFIARAELPCDSIHGIYGNDIDPSNPNETARLRAVDMFRSEGQLASQLGGSLVVIHCSGIYRMTVPEDEYARRRDQLLKSMIELADFGHASGIRYAFENLPPYHAIGHDVQKLVSLVEEVNHPNIGICLDVAHAHLASGDPVKAIQTAGKNIIYLHICDTSGQKDDHLMPFLGRLDWPAIAQAVREINYDGVFMLETFYNFRELHRLILDGAAEKLKNLLDTINK